MTEEKQDVAVEKDEGKDEVKQEIATLEEAASPEKIQEETADSPKPELVSEKPDVAKVEEYIVGEEQEVVHDDKAVVDAEEDEGIVVCCGRVTLAPGVSCCNFITMLLVSMLTIMYFVFLSAMQGFLLTEVFEVETSELGTTSAYLGTADEIWSIITLGMWGVLSDKLGRRSVVMLGFCHIAIASIIIPNSNTVFPGLLLARLLFAQGGSALSSMLSALLADYVAKKSVGRATALIGLTSGLGALLAVFGLVGTLPPQLCIDNTYYVAGAIAGVMILVSFFGLQSLETLSNTATYEAADDNACKLFYHGMKIAYSNKYIALAYLAGFLARGDTTISSVFLSNWVIDDFTENNLCGFCSLDPTDPNFDPDCDVIATSTCGEILDEADELTCPEAYTRFRVLSGIAQTLGLIVAPVFAIFADKVDPVKLLAASSLFGCTVYALVFGLNSPKDTLSLVAVSLWSVGSIAMVISAQILLVKNMPTRIRGTVAGCFSLVGALGVIFFSGVGGVLFDKWFFGAPFALAAIVSFIVCFFATGMVFKSKKSS